jgi:hypothetical protein
MKSQIEILENLLDKGLTNNEIAEILNTSRSSVVRIKSKYKLKSKYNELKREKKICLQCNKEFDCLISEERKFCSMSCSRTFLNLKESGEKITKDNSLIEKDKKIFRICESCNSEYEIDRNYMSLKRKYCSIKCQKKLEREIKFDEIRNGVNHGSKIAKRFLIDLYGEKCMKCGWCEKNPISNKVPIELEHKDGNSENNNLENLELLCPNCHSLTPTYKALNKGKGRHKRRERYKEGKSY